MQKRTATLWIAGVVIVLVVAGMNIRNPRAGESASQAKAGKAEKTASATPRQNAFWKDFEKPNRKALQEQLDAEQYNVTQESGTERPFNNLYWDHHAAGIYVDVVSGEPLFASFDKFDSGTGWPSFTRPIEADNIDEKADETHGMRRVEVRSHYGDSHLGHVFEDGPEPTGMRYCINSASLRFVPVSELASAGYAEYLPLFQGDKGATMPSRTETATLAGGCFWGMEDILRDIPGVLETEVGYSGGTFPHATYEDVKTGKTGHAESVRIVFDPDRISYAELLGYFFRMHDPTTPNRQGNDRGTQYRSAIFVNSKEQRATAERVKAEVDKSGKWDKPIVTEIVDAGSFWPAEDYHQDYLEKHPNGYTCHWLRD